MAVVVRESHMHASSVPGTWWTVEATIAGPAAGRRRSTIAAAQPSPKIAEPMIFARGPGGGLGQQAAHASRRR